MLDSKDPLVALADNLNWGLIMPLKSKTIIQKYLFSNKSKESKNYREKYEQKKGWLQWVIKSYNP